MIVPESATRIRRMRDIIAITVSQNGAYVYYDQWEHARVVDRAMTLTSPTQLICTAPATWAGRRSGATESWPTAVAPAINNEVNPCASRQRTTTLSRAT